MAKLIITSGDDVGKEIELSDTQVIGRLPSNAIPIRDDSSSRQNTRIYRSGGAYAVIDLNSKNGTFLNDERVERAVLKDGDEIRIGKTAFRFEKGTEEPEPHSRERRDAVAGWRQPSLGDAIEYGAGGGVATRAVSEKALQFSKTGPRKRGRATTFTWLRADLTQYSSLFRVLVIVGGLLIVAGIGVWIYRLTA